MDQRGQAYHSSKEILIFYSVDKCVLCFMLQKRFFIFGLVGLAFVEIAKVYLIMPLPGSQRLDTLDIAYCLHEGRWILRGVFGIMVLVGIRTVLHDFKWWALAGIAALIGVMYLSNFEMAAEKMFLQPGSLMKVDQIRNKVNEDKLVLGVAINGQASAYPIQFIGYHHQVRDVLGGEPILVTYCTVCRSGRVYSAKVYDREETFRLVGMDHFNAMLEDASTHSWWRQATGEAVTGPLEGMRLNEFAATQTTLREWFRLHPNSMVMQPDSTFSTDYADMDSYDTGLNRGELTTTDTLSWQPKSWVVGIELDSYNSRAFDWNRLKQERIIHENIGNRAVLLVLGKDGKSFFAYERPDRNDTFTMRNDSLFCGSKSWNLLGNPFDSAQEGLKKVNAYQEFWHSWSTFHPHTTRY